MKTSDSLNTSLQEIGMKIKSDTNVSDIENWFLRNHGIVFKPKVNGSKLIKFECHPWLILKRNGKTVGHQLCNYTGEHKFLIDAYEQGIIGAIKYILETNKNN